MGSYFRFVIAAVFIAAFGGVAALLSAKPPGGAVNNTVLLAAPKINKQKHEFTIPAAFWNEHLTDWLDVAICGRPSNFLHETVLSVQTTRHILKRAFRAIGYHSATRWSPDLADFGFIRGQPVLILVRFKWHGKSQTFLLDELIEFRAWHVSVGPFGWLYLGTHDPYHVAAAAGPVPKAGQRVDPADILADDPQAAMQFRGIQHASQSLLDFPLCFDNWIYPNIRYHRNSAVLSMNVFNSNGKVPATLTVRRVSEVQYLQAVEKYWHNPGFAAYAAGQLPVARSIDSARRRLWQLVNVKHLGWTNWRTERCVAQLQADYAGLQAAWVAWDVAHARFRAADNLTAAQVRGQAKLFLSHLRQTAASDHHLWLATKAFDQLHKLDQKRTASDAVKIQQLRAEELAERSRALLDSNAQDLQFWQRKLRRLKPDDPRKIWVRDVHMQYQLAEAQQAMGTSGLAYAAAMKAGNSEKPQHQYLAAILRVALARQNVQLVNVEFHITNDEGFASAKHIAALKLREHEIQKQIQRIKSQIKSINN
jgi:hypothetical protein